MIQNRSVAIIFSCILGLFSNALSADTFESLVMPGEVIEGHKKYELECSNCHKVFSKGGQDKLCLDCHKKVSKDIKLKKGFHGVNSEIKKSSCKTCHTDHKGRTADIVKLDEQVFDHNKTDFRLTGKHRVSACKSCHKENVKYRDTSSQCQSCHKKENPHKTRKENYKLFKKCQSCHTTKEWGDIRFDHSKTDYKLTGNHKEALCLSCHVNDKYKDTSTICISCHKTDDVHNGNNGNKCQKCHNTKQWGKISFNHKRDTSFPLKGKHRKTPCKSCHKKVILKKKNKKKKTEARKCYACHLYDDSHKGVFGKKCNECHSEDNWTKSKFNHDKDTEFSLKGEHKKVTCNSCHASEKIKLKKTCISCHKNDDIHVGGLGNKCQTCHIETGWDKRIAFEHDITEFPLIGLHRATSCEECHVTSDFEKTEKTCVACHNKEDIHKGKLGRDCELCHTPNNWGVWFFEHDEQSQFPLKGAHVKIHCHTCHTEKTNKIESSPRACSNCHLNDDIHNGQFGRQCDKCHTQKDFQQVEMK